MSMLFALLDLETNDTHKDVTFAHTIPKSNSENGIEMH